MNEQELLQLPPGDLEQTMADGHLLAPASLCDYEYRGLSVGLPDAVERFVKKFKKTFVQDPETGVVRGWNMRMRQNAPQAPWIPQELAGRPVTYGHYVVEPAAQHARYNRYPNALVIDYPHGGNLPWDPLSRVVDYIVAVRPDDPSLLLGRMVLDLGVQLPTPSYFVLARDIPITEPIETPAERLKARAIRPMTRRWWRPRSRSPRQ